ncbi:unnamed protein product [Ectocarpus sp. CCAP 1310/34]|nr:unnamed protein product [Ectocarpus sp. CCAP 1310/34]
MGSEARFANHSCSPNCLMQKWSVLGETRVVLVAARDISVGEELTYNYQADTLEGFVERQKCLCGEPQCSGFIGGERRASKVMNQAKPQLEVVRELFHEGRELGYELSDKGGGEGEAGDGGGANSSSAAGSGPTHYKGREMECLSIMLREGDEWLEELARVMEGTTIAAAAAAAAAASSRKYGTGAVGVEETAVQPPPAAGELPRRRASTRAGRGERKPRDAYDDDGGGGGGKVGEGEESNPDAPRVVDLVQLEKVVQASPTGLQIPEAVKAKKTLARASHVAQTVWTLLDAASKNGLKSIRVPEERQPPPPSPPPLPQPQPPQLATSNPASGGACPSVPAAASSSSKAAIVGRLDEKDKGRRGGRGAERGGRGRRGRYGSEGDHDAMMPEIGGGGSGITGAAAPAGAKSNDDATMEVRGDGSTADGSSSSSSSRSSDEPNGGDGGQQLVPLEGRCGSRDDEAEPAADAGTPGGGTDDSPVVATGACSGSGGGGSSPDCGEVLAATVAATAADWRADGDNNGNLEQGADKPAAGLSPRVAVATRSGGKRKPSAALSVAGVALRKRLVPPAATATTSSMADGSPALPPKPKMSQVCQAIRSCRGLANVFIPGAPELEKLVAPAEAWAKEACDMLKIKASRMNSTGTSNDEEVLDPSTDDPATGGAAAAGGKVKDCDRDREGEKDKSKWARLGLEGSAMTALEEKLQDVAEFSLAREQREEEVEKERLQREKEDARERERQARLEKLARLKALSKRRNAPRAVGGASTITAERGGGAAGDAVGGGSGGRASREEAVRARETRRSPRIVSLGSSGAPSTADPATARKEEAEGEGIGDAEEAGWTKEDEEALHCLCRLPADAARFRTLMTCDLCSSWFHPSCVRLKDEKARHHVCLERSQAAPQLTPRPATSLETAVQELPKRSLRGGYHHQAPALAFVCPMCEHRRGGVSNFACPPSPGFYIGRRMHRPGLSELETLMRNADSLPVDGVDGQAYLNYMVVQVVGWRDRCEDAVKDFQAYIQGGDTAEATAMKGGTPTPPTPSAGLVLASAGRRLGFEASLVERLGRLVCEGALIEVVDVHKEDTMLRRALWTLTASLCFPKATSCLRLGQEPGLEETLSSEDQEALRSSDLSQDSTTRLRPTFETLEACLTEGRALGLSRTKSKGRRSSAGATGGGGGGGGGTGEVSNKEAPSTSSGVVSSSSSSLSGAASSVSAAAAAAATSCLPLAGERPSSEPLGTGVRLYTCLFDAVGDILQAVVKAEAKPFREARNNLPALREATRWAAIEPSWGYARALASELFWRRENAAPAAAARGVHVAAAAAAQMVAEVDSSSPAPGEPTVGAQSARVVQEEQGGDVDVYCICREGDDGGVMVECDLCGEWYHASWWSTNVAIEAAVRRATPRRTANRSNNQNPAQQQQQQQLPKEVSSNTGEEEGADGRRFDSPGRWPRATGNAATSPAGGERSVGPSTPNFSDASASAGGGGGEGAVADGSSNGGQDHHPVAGGRPPVVVGTKAAAEPAGLASKRLRDKGSSCHGRGGDNRPGAKRTRAAGSVARYVESVAREFAGLGIPFPPLPPPLSPPREAPAVAAAAAAAERCCRRTGVVARVMGSEASSAGRCCAALVVDDVQEVAALDVEPAAAAVGGSGAGVVARARGSESSSGCGVGCAAPAFEERTFDDMCRPGVGEGREGGGGQQGEGKGAEALSQPVVLRPNPMAEILAGAGLVGSSGGGSSSGGAEQGFVVVTRHRPQQGSGSRHVYLHQQQHHRQHHQHQTLKQGKGYGYGMVWPPPPPLPSFPGITPKPHTQHSSSIEPQSSTSGVLPFGVVPAAEPSAVGPHARCLQAVRPRSHGDGGSHDSGRKEDHAGTLLEKRSAGGTRGQVIGVKASTAVVTEALAWTSHEQRPTATTCAVVGRDQAEAGGMGAGSTKESYDGRKKIERSTNGDDVGCVESTGRMRS